VFLVAIFRDEIHMQTFLAFSLLCYLPEKKLPTVCTYMGNFHKSSHPEIEKTGSFNFLKHTYLIYCD
jgi:hypothetical protein